MGHRETYGRAIELALKRFLGDAPPRGELDIRGGASMPFETLIHQITAGGFQAIHLTPFLIGVYIAFRHVTSRRAAPVVAQDR